MDLKNLCFPDENKAKVTINILMLCFIYVFSESCLYAGEKKTNLSIGVQNYYHIYKETGIKEQTGPFMGVTVKYASKGSCYYSLEGDVSNGVLDNNTDQYESINTKSDTRFQLRGTGGIIIKTGYESEILSYTGIAMRFFSYDASYRPQYNIDYNRQSTYLYIPFGISYTRNLSKKMEP